MNKNNSAKISSELKKQIISQIITYKKVKKIIVFGSRSRGDQKITSDIDIAIVDDNYTSTDINLISDRLENIIPTALGFDVVNYNTIAKDSFKNAIDKDGVVIYEA